MQVAAQLSTRIGLIVRIGIGVAILGFGAYTAEPGAPRLMIFGLALFTLPLLLQFSPWPLARAYALWFGMFLIVQALITPLVAPFSLIGGYPPNTTMTVTFADGVRPGVAGPQRITTDEFAFRVNPRVDYQRKAGLRIFAIGGSTTEQADMDDEATWTHLVQVALAKESGKPVEVINTGVAGLRTEHHVATLKRILPLDSDIVVFLVGVNDWHFDIHSRFGSDAPSLLVKFPETLLGRTARRQFNLLYSARPFDYTYSVPPRGRSLERERKLSWFPEAAERYLANLASISEICRANSLTCIFLTQPNAYQPDPPDELKDRFAMTPINTSYTLTFESLVHLAQLYNRALIDFSNRQSHVLCDLAPEIAPTTENFTDEVHFTTAGSKRVAELVTECLGPLVAKVERRVPDHKLEAN